MLRSGDPDGFLPHTVFWDAPAGWRRAPLYATETSFGSWRTASIDPPLLPLAWEHVARASAPTTGTLSPSAAARVRTVRRSSRPASASANSRRVASSLFTRASCSSKRGATKLACA